MSSSADTSHSSSRRHARLSGGARDSVTTGAVGVVESLTLIARMERGKLRYLQWHQMGCGECGGRGSARCFNVGDGERACGANVACLDPFNDAVRAPLASPG